MQSIVRPKGSRRSEQNWRWPALAGEETKMKTRAREEGGLVAREKSIDEEGIQLDWETSVDGKGWRWRQDWCLTIEVARLREGTLKLGKTGGGKGSPNLESDSGGEGFGGKAGMADQQLGGGSRHHRLGLEEQFARAIGLKAGGRCFDRGTQLGQGFRWGTWSGWETQPEGKRGGKKGKEVELAARSSPDRGHSRWPWVDEKLRGRLVNSSGGRDGGLWNIEGWSTRWRMTIEGRWSATGRSGGRCGVGCWAKDGREVAKYLHSLRRGGSWPLIE